MHRKSCGLVSLIVFAAAAGVLFWLCGNRLTLNADEGIYLDGALRVMHGEAPYRDFFVHTGPGTYWLYAAVFRLTGPMLSHARAPVILEVAAIAAGVFYLTRSLTTAAYGLATTFIFFAFQIHDLGMIALNHRWDSSAMAFLALTPAYASIATNSRGLAFLTGLLAAAAAWFTPTLATVAIVIALWMLAVAGLRSLLPAFLLGMAALSSVCIGILAVEKDLIPMIEHFLWTGANYSSANHVPYGWAGAGYADIGAGLGVAGWIFLVTLLTVVAVPAVLPLLTWLGWGIYFAIRRAAAQREMQAVFLILCSAALLTSTYPRWDIGHLLYVAPIFYVLAAALLYRLLPAKMTQLMFGFLTLVAVLIWTPVLAGVRDYSRMETAAGTVRVLPEDRKLIEMLLKHIGEGDSLFVFPYFPTIYFLTHGINPTHFSYLQPGLMTNEDEEAALKELQARPPEWIFHNEVPPENYLKHWPSSDPSRLRLKLIEQFIGDNYRTVEKQSHRLGEFSLRKHN